MILRLTERTDRIAHVPRVLYHWRAHRDSTAGGERPSRMPTWRRATPSPRTRIASGSMATSASGPRASTASPTESTRRRSVDLVLAVAGLTGSPTAAASWLAQPHPTWNVVVAAPAGVIAAVGGALTAAGLPEARITAVRRGGLAAAAAAATAEHLLLMQTPAAGLTHDWLTRLLGYSAQPGIAAAGPLLLAPDGRIQQAGIAIPKGIPLHLLHGTRSSMDDLFGYGTSVYNVSAVSGILATPRATYQQLGGL